MNVLDPAPFADAFALVAEDREYGRCHERPRDPHQLLRPLRLFEPRRERSQ